MLTHIFYFFYFFIFYFLGWAQLSPCVLGWTQPARPGHWPKPVTRLGCRHAWFKPRVRCTGITFAPFSSLKSKCAEMKITGKPYLAIRRRRRQQQFEHSRRILSSSSSQSLPLCSCVSVCCFFFTYSLLSSAFLFCSSAVLFFFCFSLLSQSLWWRTEDGAGFSFRIWVWVFALCVACVFLVFPLFFWVFLPCFCLRSLFFSFCMPLFCSAFYRARELAQKPVPVTVLHLQDC